MSGHDEHQLRTARRTPRAIAAATVAAALMLSACASSARRDGLICDDADKQVVKDVMAKARTNFQTGDSITDHFDFVKAATRPIPESKQKFGATTLMVLLVSVYIQDSEIPSKLQGVQGPVYVVLDADGKPMGGLGTFSQPFFDIGPPADPGWTEWADALDRTKVASGLFGCVNPSRR